jgi:hypothetical protein
MRTPSDALTAVTLSLVAAGFIAVSFAASSDSPLPHRDGVYLLTHGKLRELRPSTPSTKNHSFRPNLLTDVNATFVFSGPFECPSLGRPAQAGGYLYPGGSVAHVQARTVASNGKPGFVRLEPAEPLVPGTYFLTANATGRADDADVIFELWVPNGAPSLVSEDHERAWLTMQAIHQIAFAIEAYSIDFGVYPAVKNVKGLQPMVTPTYMSRVPFRDGWGRPIQCIVREDFYEVRSLGSDGRRDKNVLRGQSDGFGRDLVFTDGEFVQWPNGLAD